MAKNKDTPSLSKADIVKYLTEHPDCLTERPDVLEKCFAATKSKTATTLLDNPKIVNLGPTLAKRARNEARRLSLANKSLLHVASENIVSWRRLHHATLGLLASNDLAELYHVISKEFPVIFDLKQCALIIEAEAQIADTLPAGLDTHPTSQIRAALLDRSLFLGAPNKAALSLLNYDAPSVALVRLPDRLLAPVSKCVLLLGGKSTTSFQPTLGSDLLVLLAEMIGVTLAARLASLASKP